MLGVRRIRKTSRKVHWETRLHRSTNTVFVVSRAEHVPSLCYVDPRHPDVVDHLSLLMLDQLLCSLARSNTWRPNRQTDNIPNSSANSPSYLLPALMLLNRGSGHTVRRCCNLNLNGRHID